METIAFEFTARRYHATPWDAHVNEGRIEWPPCPWRLLRTLIAVGYCKLNWMELTATAESLIGKLASVYPEYSLPDSIESHTRHYMPSREGSKEKKVKVFDAFLRFDSPTQSLMVRYPVSLTEQERSLLVQLVEGVAYLGRAESWVEASLVDSSDATDNEDWITVAGDSDENRTRLLAAVPPDEYSQWRDAEVSTVEKQAVAKATQLAEAKGKKPTKGILSKARSKASQPYPDSIVDALQLPTSRWQSEGWPRPPGSHWVDYQSPSTKVKRRPLVTVLPRRSPHKPQAILLAIDGEGKRGTLRPRMPRCLPLMEALHATAVSKMASLGETNVPELTGVTDDGTPRTGTHNHAHWMPLSLINQPGTAGDSIDHAMVYVPYETRFCDDAVRAVADIRWCYAKGIRDLSINLVGQGDLDQIVQQLEMLPMVNQSSLKRFGTSTVWQSATPLVLRKYLHRRGKKTVEGQIREELAERGFPQPVEIHIYPNDWMVRNRLKGFVLRRQPGKNQPPFEKSWAVRIKFGQPVTGPLSLGYASHFGLGLFRRE